MGALLPLAGTFAGLDCFKGCRCQSPVQAPCTVPDCVSDSRPVLAPSGDRPSRVNEFVHCHVRFRT